jgi:molybdopterin-guanine dinucleotide biosynthesis protein A
VRRVTPYLVVPYVVVVPAGGASTRFGSDKVAVLLDRVLAGLPAGVPVVCVGPPRATPGRTDVHWVRESPPGSGPLAAVATAVLSGPAELADVPVVVLSGADMPHIGAAVPPLVDALAASDDVDVAVLVDGTGARQPLASAWRRPSLVAALARIGPPGSVPLRRLLDGVVAVEVVDAWDAAHDVDTPADL